MIKYELFPKYEKNNWNSPLLKVYPAEIDNFFETFTVNQLHQFKAYNLQNVSLKDGHVVINDIERHFPREFASKTLDTFIDISGIGFGNWHLLQGVFLPDLPRERKYPFYIGDIDAEHSEIELAGPERVVYKRIAFDEVIPYGNLFCIDAKHPTELFSKLTDEFSLIERQHRRLKERHEETPSSNAYVQVSDHMIGKSGDSEKVTVLVGYLKR